MVEILPMTPTAPLEIIGKCAGVCRGADDTPEANIERAYDCIESGHFRVLEFVDVYLKISGYSARVIREWYTHIGCLPTRLQESTRYVNCENFTYTTPIELDETQAREYSAAMEAARTHYAQLVRLGVKREDAALVMPLGMHTTIIDKRNLRNFVDICHQRLCRRAYWEFRQLVLDIIEALRHYGDEKQWRPIIDLLFVPKCDTLGHCPEKRGCGKKVSK